MRNVELDDVLETCIAEIRCRRATVEECLQQYPERASALASLLRQAARLIALPPVTMPANAVDVLEGHLLNRATETRGELVQKRLSARWSFLPRLVGRRIRLSSVGLGLVFALMIASIWTVSVSASSLPGDVLYPVKLAAEQARLAVTIRHVARARLHLAFAERRLMEIDALLHQETPPGEGLFDALADETTLALKEIEETGVDQGVGVAAELLAVTERQRAVLTWLQQRLPPAAQKGLSRALEASQCGYERAIMTLGVMSEPSQVPSEMPSSSLTPALHVTPTGTPELVQTPEPAEMPGQPEVVGPTETPEPTETLEPTETPEPTGTPESTETAEPDTKPKRTKTPKPKRTKTPKPKG